MAFQIVRFIRENRLYFILLTFLMLAGGAWIWLMPKGALLWWFSAHRSAAGDLFFRIATHGGEVAGFLIAFTLLWRKSTRWPLALATLTLTVSLVSNGTKTFFEQPRPARYFKEMGNWQEIVPVPGVELHEGMNSLPSGHTMAAFAFFSLMAFCIRDKRLGAVLAFLAALLTGLSRIYLVQHFEEDVLLGAVLGVLLAAVFYHLFLKVPDKWWRPGERISAEGGIRSDQ